MFNRERTKEVFGYDLDLNLTRRSTKDFEHTNKVCRKRLKVIDNCPECGKERKITLNASRKNKSCCKCHHAKQHVIEAKKNRTKIVSEETKQKMRDNHFSKRGIVNFKGCKHTKEAKIKLREAHSNQFNSYSEEYKSELRKKAVCTMRGISVENFDGFSSPENTRLRQSESGKTWIKDILTKNNFTCQKCKIRGGTLCAHHKDAFASFPNRRFDIDNGACLCQQCHTEFHVKYGKGHNTEIQFNEWIEPVNLMTTIPTLYLICGVPGAGKSWVCNQLSNCIYISFDGNSKKDHLQLLQKAGESSLPVIYDPTFKISTFIKRHGHLFDIKAVFIIESDETLKQRIANRGGEWTDSLTKRIKQITKRSEKYGVFSGTSNEVLAYMVNELKVQ